MKSTARCESFFRWIALMVFAGAAALPFAAHAAITFDPTPSSGTNSSTTLELVRDTASGSPSGQYIGVRFSSSPTLTNAYAKATVGGTGYSLDATEPAKHFIGGLGATPATSYWFINNPTSGNGTFQVQIYEGDPDAGGVLQDTSTYYTLNSQDADQSASANKITSVTINNGNAVALGQSFDVVVVYTVNSTANILVQPAASAAFDPSALRLGATMVQTYGSSDGTGVPLGTFNNQLYFKNPGSSINSGRATFTFQAVAVSSVSLSPLVSARNGQYKYNADYSVPPVNVTIPTPVNRLSVRKSVDVALSATATNVTYSLVLSNSGSSAAQFDQFSDTLPSGVTYLGTVKTNGVAATLAPVITGSTLVFPNPGGAFVVAAGGTFTLSFKASVPGTLGNYTNQAVANLNGNVIGDTETIGSSPAKAVTIIGAIADVTVTKTGVTSALAGTNLTYTIAVTNLGPATSSNVVVSDTLPSGATFVSASGGGTHSASVVMWPTMTNFASGATTNFTVTITAPGSGPITNRVSSTASNGDPTPGNNDGSAAAAQVITTLTPLADVQTTKTGLTNALAGTNITYTITVTNLGPSTSSNVVASDIIPTNSTFVSANGGGTYNSASGTVTWPGMNLTNTAVTNFSVTITAPTSDPITNRVSSTANTGDPAPGNNNGSAAAAQVITTLTPTANIAVFKSGPTNANAGDSLAFIITVTNQGPHTSSNVVVRDTLPTGFTFVSASGGGTLSGSVVTWPTLGSFTNGATTNFTVNVTASRDGYQTNRAHATADTADPVAANNDGTAAASQVVTTVIPSADVTVAKTGPVSATVGDNLIYTIAVTNLGVSPAENVVVSDTLPAGVTFVSASDGGTHTAGIVTWPTIPELPAAAWTNYTVTIAAGIAGSVTNIAASTSTTHDPNPGNNASTNASARVVTTVNSANSGVLVSGCVYLDANRNLQKDNSEAGTALALFAKLIPAALPGGPATQAVAVATGNGQFVFSNVLAGAYSIVLDDNATTNDVTPTLPSGWTGTEMPEFKRGNVAVGGVNVPNQNFGLINATGLTGKVFKDTGAGGGTANDGAQNGGETGLPGVTLRLTDHTGAITYDTATTDGNGQFTLQVPGTLASGTTLKVVEVNPSGHLSIGASGGNSGGSYDRASDTLTFTLTAGTSYSGIQFGDVPENALANDSQQSGLPGSFVLHAHTFIAGSGGQVTFTTTSTPTPALVGWSQVIHRDLDCDGQLDPGEPVLSAPVSVIAGERVCLLVKDVIPLGAPLHAQNRITVTAEFTYTAATPASATAQTRSALTTVGTPTTAGLTLVKSVDKTSALPGDTLTYTITYANQGTESLRDVVIFDETPAFTDFCERLQRIASRLPDKRCPHCAVVRRIGPRSLDFRWNACPRRQSNGHFHRRSRALNPG